MNDATVFALRQYSNINFNISNILDEVLVFGLATGHVTTPKRAYTIHSFMHYPNSNPDLPVPLSMACLIEGLVTSLCNLTDYEKGS